MSIDPRCLLRWIHIGESACDHARSGILQLSDAATDASPHPCESRVRIVRRRAVLPAAAALVVSLALLAGCSSVPGEDAGMSGSASPAASASSEGSAEAPASDAAPDPQQVAYELYHAKVQEYLAAYGAPGCDGSAESAFDVQTGTGLALVQLRDFDGDGIEELIVGYVNPDTADYMQPYIVEVWAVRDGELACVFAEPDALDHGQDVLTGFTTSSLDGEPVIETTIYGPSEVFAPHGAHDGVGAWAYRDGAFVQVLSCMHEYTEPPSGQESYLVDGEPSDAEGYRAARDRATASDYWQLRGYGGATGIEGAAMHAVPETIAETERVIDLLAASMGA